jgi:flagellar biosynthetic protein FliO
MNAAPNMVSGAFQMLAALGIVLGGLLIVLYLMKRYIKRDVRDSNGRLIKVLASQYIGLKKNIALVKVPGSILVVGITNERISLLSKIEDKAIQENIHLEASGISPTFSDHLQRLTARFKSPRASEK